MEIKLKGLWEEMVNSSLFSHYWLFYVKSDITEILIVCHCGVINILLKEFQNEDKYNFRNEKI